MTMQHDPSPITPLILCGGSGSRLWPLSRKTYPKQFARLIGEESLLQGCARRFRGEGFADPIVVTGEPFRFMVDAQLAEIGTRPRQVIVEPASRDTGPAILAGALVAAAEAPEALLLVAPSDHLIPDSAALRHIIRHAVPAARAGQIVAFGITPTRPETGYGYLEPSASSHHRDGVVPVARFIEKPDRASAENLIATGAALWNAGLYLFKAATLIDMAREIAPGLMDPVTESVRSATTRNGFFHLGEATWSKIDAQSIDYAIMEHAANLCVAPFSGAWSDLGDWDAVWRETETSGLAQNGSATAIDCADTMLRSEVDGQAIVGIGLQDIVAIAMPDAVLVSHKSRTQDVKHAVARLKAAELPQAETYPKDHRPWGWFESLARGDRFQVKRIRVHPGASLSLQSHHHRAEHWIVVEGTAKVTVGETTRLVGENEAIYIPLGARHRLENPGKLPMTLIEVQTGSYLGEDDIIRHEDIYARI